MNSSTVVTPKRDRKNTCPFRGLYNAGRLGRNWSGYRDYLKASSIAYSLCLRASNVLFAAGQDTIYKDHSSARIGRPRFIPSSTAQKLKYLDRTRKNIIFSFQIPEFFLALAFDSSSRIGSPPSASITHDIQPHITAAHFGLTLSLPIRFPAELCP
jgi:hypothetical protein